MEGLFTGLDAIPWSELSHAHGPADDVPDLLRGLVSAAEDERLVALYKLMETVWHQGTVYQASSQVVPFLGRMLGSPRVPDRSIIAMLLASIADGHAYFQDHPPEGGLHRETWQQSLAAEGKDLEQQAALEQEWVRAVREAVDPFVSLLYEFLEDKEAELRYAVALALGKYLNHAEKSLEALRAAARVERQAYVKEAMAESIQRLEEATEQAVV